MPPIPDAAARRRFGPWAPDGLPSLDAFDPEANAVVRAAAGSGKTTALVGRMVALVRTGVPVGDLAAITFTRKAAAEMQARLVHDLEAARDALAARAPSDPRARLQHARVTQALADLGEAFVGTIHAFCARLLREHALAAGLPPDFTAGIEPRDERRLRRQAWRDHLAATFEADPGVFDRLDDLGVRAGQLRGFFGDLIRFEDLTPFTDAPDDPPDLSAAVEAARALLTTWQARRPSEMPDGKGRDGVMTAFDRAERHLRFVGLERRADRADFLAFFEGTVKNDKAKVTLNRWGSTKNAKDAAKRLRDELLPHLVEHTVRPVLRAWEAYVYARLVEIVHPAVARYAARRRADGQLTFQDLLLTTRDLLRDRPDVRRAAQARYPRLLVDEFQDTDPIQAEIVFFLASDDPDEADWRRCRPAPGRLFIVGDDKQSIYRFRRADNEVFADVADLVASHPEGEKVELRTNFRSVAPLCRWCDDAFGPAFEAAGDVQAAYVPFHPHRDDGADAYAVRSLTTPKIAYNRSADIAADEAERIARFIRAAVDGRASEEVLDDATAGDFMILTRLSKRLVTYAEALARYDLPFTLTGGKDVGASPGLRALVDLLAAVAAPDDAVARLAVLRGRLVGLSDDDLYALRRAGGRFDDVPVALPEAVRAALDPALAARLDRAYARLARARALLTRLRPSTAIEQVVDEAGLVPDALHAAHDDATPGTLAAGRLLRALVHVRALDAQGLHWTEIADELQRVIDGEDELDGLTLDTGAPEAVRLMNVHQAKGLEARVVFLADPYDGRHNPSPDWHVDRASGRCVIPAREPKGPYASTLLAAPAAWHDTFEAREAAYAEAEEQRLQYVAATRAQEVLVVSRYEAKPDDGFWRALYPCLDAHDVPELCVPAAPSDAAPSDAGAEGTPPARPAPNLAPAARDAALARVATARFAEATMSGQDAPRLPALAHTSDGENGRRRPGRRFVARDDGYGTAFGAAVHALVAHVVTHRMATEVSAGLVRRVLREHDADPGPASVRRARRMLRAWQASDLGQRVRHAALAHAEYPVALRRDEADADAEAPVVLERGVIDVLFQEDAPAGANGSGDETGGWHLVEIKTDRLPTTDVRAEVLARATPQARRYAAAWAAATAAPLACATVWLADTGEAVRVEI